MRSIQHETASSFASIFGGKHEWLFRAPGRVNLIGEHTDYNDGFVMPIAIDRAIWIAARPRADRRVVLYSLDFDEHASFHLDELTKGDEGWLEYVKGVAWALAEAGYETSGWEGVIGGDIPVGAGLSSSAALELVVARVFTSMAGSNWDATEMALIGRRVENQWIGVNSGIMDQLIVATGREGHAMFIDCRTLDLTPTPLPEGIAVVVMDTGTRRGLVDSAYNERRSQCETAAHHFGAKALRDVSLETLESRIHELDDVTARRARHVVSENKRTIDAAEAMRRGDVARLGLLMDESHRSLRDDFEVSSSALDLMVSIARKQPGCYGARMTGAGFGGCAVAVVNEDAAEGFVAEVHRRYADESGMEPRLYVSLATGGASVVERPTVADKGISRRG